MTAEPMDSPSRREPLIIGLIVGVGLLALAVWASRPQVLPIKELRFVGSFERVDADRLRDEVAPRIDGNFFAVDVDRIHDAVQALAWVDEVWVDRVWPHTLQLRVKEQQPLLLWRDEGVLNARGELFSTEQPEGLPRLLGPNGSRERMTARFHEFSASLAPMAAIEELKLDARGSWEITLRGGAQLMAGREQVVGRLKRLVRVWPALAAGGKQAQRIDLRYANGVAVRWRDKTARLPVLSSKVV